MDVDADVESGCGEEPGVDAMNLRLATRWHVRVLISDFERIRLVKEDEQTMNDSG
jgi:hypothetical protein